MALLNSSTEVARNPVRFPSQEMTISCRGPPELCATTSNPAAIISTTPMPKCSFHMVWSPTLALANHSFLTESGWFKTNSTESPSPKDDTRSRRARTLLSSSPPRQLPISTNLAAAVHCGYVVRSIANARICRIWSFSGRNCPMDTMIGSFRTRERSFKDSVSQGGKTVWILLLRPAPPTIHHHKDVMWFRVHDEFTMTRLHKLPAMEYKHAKRT